MPRTKTSFDDHMSMIAGQQKTANQKPVAGNSPTLLQKLAEELGVGGATPVGGQVANATGPVTEVAPTVEAATAAVTDPQVAVAGGVPAIAAVGMEPAAVKPNEAEVVTSGDGTAKTINEFGKTPEAAAAAANESVVSNYDTGSAEKLGSLIAESFVKHLEKIAKQQQYTESLGILKEAGLLDAYVIKDQGLTKTASAPVDYLEKIAQKETLSHDDVIGAANQFVDFIKQAEEAEEKGKEDAGKLVEALNEAAEEKGEGEGKDEEAAAEAATDPEVAKAIQTLQDKGVL